MTHHNNKHDTPAADANSQLLSTYTTNMPSTLTDEEAVAELDEPPEPHIRFSPSKEFKRTTVRRPNDARQPSLLTKALQSQSEEEDVPDAPRPHLSEAGRRRSMTSNVSLASTADLTSDTGLTSPSRMSTPSPPLPELRMLRLSVAQLGGPPPSSLDKAEAVAARPQPALQQPAPRRKCISFACVAKPTATPAVQPVAAPAKPLTASNAPGPGPVAANAPRRPCIKFACPTQNAPSISRPRPVVSTPPRQPTIVVDDEDDEGGSPNTIRKPRSPAVSRSPRPTTPRRASGQVLVVRSRKYLTANSKELTECSRFHEFASDEHREDDWIVQDSALGRRRITINDTLTKENAIRKLATEVEQEAEAEEEEDDEDDLIDAEDDDDDDQDDEVDVDAEENDDEEEDEVDDDDDGYDVDGNLSGYDSDDGSSGGYHTDEETGFAESDDEDDGLHLWNPAGLAVHLSTEARMPRRSSVGELMSDSSIATRTSVRARRGSRTRHIKIRPGTPELPDSTDFVCGTLDEDRPMEDAYISCLAARKREKMQIIPQDIDPSFPASDPEDDEDRQQEYFNPVHRDSDDDVWLHGEMEDVHPEQGRGRHHPHLHHRKKENTSPPRRFHSPPPKQRHHSPPPPKARGRSPPPMRRLFERPSPRRMRSPPPSTAIARSPPASPRGGNRQSAIAFKALGSRPGPTQTKSLPRPPALFPHLRKGGRARQQHHNADGHVRGAIDIVKGLQQKRQRRKEKYHQMYCHRARKGQIPERKPLPGQGAERMRELGLIMAGKIGQGNYVLSV